MTTTKERPPQTAGGGGVWEEVRAASAQRRSGDWQGAEARLRGALAREGAQGPLQSSLAWALYDGHLRGRQELTPAMERAGREILSLCRQDDAYGPYERTALFLLGLCARGGSRYHVSKGLAWAARLDRSLLSRQETRWPAAPGEEGTGDSPYLSYCLKVAKMLHQAGKHGECLALLEEAQSCQGEWQRQTKDWLAYRRGQCLLELGRYEEAEAQLQSMLERQKDWFLWRDLAELYWRQGRLDEAAEAAASAALAQGQPGFKRPVFELLARVYRQRGDQAASLDHVRLVLAVQQENGWRQKPALLAYFKARGGRLEEVSSSQLLLKRLQHLWREEKYRGQPRLSGVVDRLLPSGRDGFVRADDGQRYYFRLSSVTEGRGRLREQAPVLFYTEASFDAKKNRPSRQAVQLCVVNAGGEGR